MKLLKATLLVLTALHVTPEVKGLEVDIDSHLHHLATHRYPNEEHEAARQRAAEYISKRFEECGLRVDLQPISAFAAPHPGGDFMNCTNIDTCHVTGMNIIGLSGPERDEAGSVVVVGAGYDTDGVGSPLHDNGAGVAVLLETARLYHALSPQPRLATLFVAFDLSLDRYGRKAFNGSGDGGGGVAGGYSLVQDYLRSFVDQDTSKVGGAIVLGPLMNVNHDEGSQGFDYNLPELFPAAHREIEAGGHRGDFLAMVTRGREEGEAEHTLTRHIAHSFREVGVRLVEFSLGNETHTRLPPSLPPRQAVFFWDSTYEGRASPLPAILLTDTETNRAWPSDRGQDTNLTKAQRVFLNNAVNSLVHFLVHRQPVGAFDWLAAREQELVAALLASLAVNLLLMVHVCHLCTSSHTDNHSHSHTDDDCPSETLTLEDMKCAVDYRNSVSLLS